MVGKLGNLSKVKGITGAQRLSGFVWYVKINGPLSIKRSLISMVEKKKEKYIFGSIYVV